MLNDDPRRPKKRPKALEEGEKRHLFAVPDLSLSEESLRERIDYLTDRVAAGDRMLADLKGCLDSLKAQVESLTSKDLQEQATARWEADLRRAEERLQKGLPQHAACADRQVPSRTRTRLRAAVVAAVTALVGLYWVLGWAWRLVAPALTGGALD